MQNIPKSLSFKTDYFIDDYLVLVCTLLEERVQFMWKQPTVIFIFYFYFHVSSWPTVLVLQNLERVLEIYFEKK